MLVIGAHSADFVWRAGGAVAVCTAAGGIARVIALSYGERGESGELWKEEGQTVERVKEIRHGEAERAAAALGADFACLDLGDYPLEIDRDALRRDRRRDPRVRARRADHPHRHRPVQPRPSGRLRAVERARRLAAGAGVASAFETIKPPALFLFEPHQPELCNFTPTTFVDITAVIERKLAAMAEMKAQQYLQTYYAQRAEQRGNHARRASGDSRDPPGRGVPARDPAGGERAVSPPSTTSSPALGSATVYEAGGRRGYVDADLVQVVPGSRAAGPARTVRCGQDDNLMVHAAMASLEPGEVLVLTMPEPRPVALIGDLLATQAKAHGAAAVLVDASVRDVEELAELGLPVWARWVRIRGADKDIAGLDRRAGHASAARRSGTGDVLVLDADGVAVVEHERVDEVLAASRDAARGRARQAREARRRARCRSSSTGCASGSKRRRRER